MPPHSRLPGACWPCARRPCRTAPPTRAPAGCGWPLAARRATTRPRPTGCRTPSSAGSRPATARLQYHGVVNHRGHDWSLRHSKVSTRRLFWFGASNGMWLTWHWWISALENITILLFEVHTDLFLSLERFVVCYMVRWLSITISGSP